MNALERRIIELSFKHKLSHISSCLNTVNLLADIYVKKAKDDIVVLANGHSGLALYIVLESLGLCDAEEMIAKHGVHPSRDEAHGIMCSSGSLGQSETVALGMALADSSKIVWLVTSDGACAEGSVYEAMRIAVRYCHNLRIAVVFNGSGAYGEVFRYELPRNAKIYTVDQDRYPEWLRGIDGHYLTLTEAQRDELLA